MSAFLNNEALAQGKSANANENSTNSQTMALLQSNSFSSPALDNENADLNIVEDNALRPNTPNIGAIGGEDFSFDGEDLEIYVVHTGDTVAIVADLFGVSVDTILSANNLSPGEKLKTGDILLILPFSGVEHTVTKGETLDSIATLYKISKSDIIAANIDLGEDYTIVPGEKLIIPGANMISKAKPATSKVGSTVASTMKSVAGYFINPLPSGRKTQGLHDKYAIDIGAPTGTPIRAAASGTVTFAAMGWNGAYGNVVFIKHPNGTETRYAHMSRLNTSTGRKVGQGDIIGYVGSTGRSTGPHLHFEVRGAKNPF